MTALGAPLVKNKAGEGESCAFINFSGPPVLKALFSSIMEAMSLGSIPGL